MGAVYEAVRVDDFHKKVALKIIRQGLDTDYARTRFPQERQTLAGWFRSTTRAGWVVDEAEHFWRTSGMSDGSAGVDSELRVYIRGHSVAPVLPFYPPGARPLTPPNRR